MKTNILQITVQSLAEFIQPAHARTSSRMDPSEITREEEEAMVIKKIFKLIPGDGRKTALPIARPVFDAHYKIQAAVFWTEDKIHYTNEYMAFKRLPEDEQRCLRMLHVCFSRFDDLAGNIFSVAYAKLAEYIYDFKMIITYQAMMENIHARGYAIALQQLTLEEPQVLDECLMEFQKFPLINDIYRWVQKYTQVDTLLDYPLAIFAVALFEGVFFSGAFAIILYYSDVLPAIADLNRYIARDEGQHHITSFLVYSLVNEQFRLTEEDAHQITREFLDIIWRFYADITPRNVDIIHHANILKYLQYMCDFNLEGLGYKKLYNVEMSLDYMREYSNPILSNLHERHSQDYTLPTAPTELVSTDSLGERPVLRRGRK